MSLRTSPQTGVAAQLSATKERYRCGVPLAGAIRTLKNRNEIDLYRCSLVPNFTLLNEKTAPDGGMHIEIIDKILYTIIT